MTSPFEENAGKILSGGEIIGNLHADNIYAGRVNYDLKVLNKTLYICVFNHGRWKWIPLKDINQKNYKEWKSVIIKLCLKSYEYDTRPSNCFPITLSGATGSNAEQINGTFYPVPGSADQHGPGGHTVYLRNDGNAHKRWIYWVPTTNRWRIGNTRYKNERKGVGWVRNVGVSTGSTPLWEIPSDHWQIWTGSDNSGQWISCPDFTIYIADLRIHKLQQVMGLLKKETENNGFYIQLNEKYRECCAALFNKMNKEEKKTIINSIPHLKGIFKKENICSSCFSCKPTTPCVHFECPGACKECRTDLDTQEQCCACGKSQKMQCPICFDSFSTDHLEIFKCRHCVCLRCYLQSYKLNKKLKKCPTCRAVLPKNHIVV